jgi:transcription initiation factor TFIIB
LAGSLATTSVGDPASLHAACREGKVPITLDDVAAASGVRRDGIARCYRLLVNELGIEIPVVDPEEFMQKVASKAKMNEGVQARALEILHRAEKAGVAAGVDPQGITGSVLYMAAALEGQKLTQKDTADAAGVQEATVRREYKRLRTVLGIG